jgi:hypothetical protein
MPIKGIFSDSTAVDTSTRRIERYEFFWIDSDEVNIHVLAPGGLALTASGRACPAFHGCGGRGRGGVARPR